MDEGNQTTPQLAVNGEDEYDSGLPLSSAYRFPSLDDDEGEDDRRDELPELTSPSPSLDFNPMHEAHPGSRMLRWLFAVEFLLMIPLLPLELLLPDDWSLPLILLYSLLMFVHVLVAISMFGLLYDPWHNNIVKGLRVHQGVLGACSLLMLVLFGYLIVMHAGDTEGSERVPDELSLSLGHKNSPMPYHLGSGLTWAVMLLICIRCFVTLSKQKFDISTGTGCCPVIRCRACRVTCFLGLPDASVALRYHQHHGGDSEGISINTLHKREISFSKPRTLPLPGEDGPDHGPAHFDKRGSVDYFAPIWKTQPTLSAATIARRNSDIDTPRLSGSAPSEWSRWPGPPMEIKKKDSPYMVSRSVGHLPVAAFGKPNPDLRAPLLAHKES